MHLFLGASQVLHFGRFEFDVHFIQYSEQNLMFANSFESAVVVVLHYCYRDIDKQVNGLLLIRTYVWLYSQACTSK